MNDKDYQASHKLVYKALSIPVNLNPHILESLRFSDPIFHLGEVVRYPQEK